MKILRLSAIWCPACLIMRPIYDKIATDLNLETEELDYDMDEEAVAKLNVGSILPVAIIYDNNQELLRICGEKKYDHIKEMIEGLK